jgi:hypothetical protein
MGGASPPKLGGQIEKKKFWEVKIRKNNKIEGKILIFFFLIFFFFWREPWSPKVAPLLTMRNKPPQAPIRLRLLPRATELNCHLLTWTFSSANIQLTLRQLPIHL